MRKIVLIAISLFTIAYTTHAQKVISKNGHISFYSHTAMEDIKADNNQVSSIIDQSTGEVRINVLMKSFKFDGALMEEHFNENYVESDKYPKANLSGKIINLTAIDFTKNGTYNTEIEGELTMHGVTNKLTAKGTIEIKDGNVIAKSKFFISLKEYKIEIPAVVKDKIQDNMEITVDMEYAPLKK